MKKIVSISLIYLFVFVSGLSGQKSGQNYASSSVLSSGQWYRIAVLSDGIYRIDYSRLKQLGLLNPSNPRLYCNNSGQLSYYNNDPAADDLKEIPVYTSTGSDGIFNEGDYLLFFGKGTHRWTYNEKLKDYDFLRHNYSDTAYYFITSSATTQGKRIITLQEPTQAATFISSLSDALYIHEIENENLLKSGREWFQQILDLDINPGFSEISTTSRLKYKIRVAARAGTTTTFRLYDGGSLKKSIQVPGINLYNYTGIQAQIVSDTGSFLPSSAAPVLQLRFSGNSEPGAKGWVDFVQLKGRRTNSFTGKLVQYSDSRSVAPGGITSYSIKSQINDALIWDISDPENPKQVLFTKTGDNITFKSLSDSLKSFVAFTLSNASVPVIKTAAIPNQNLHGSESADMIIVTHPLFKSHAEKLAEIHFANSGLISQIVTPVQIYNEFSGGIPDIAAIRNYVRMKYIKQSGTDHPLKYLLLFGDGSYENKTLPPGNPNFIPTYQSQNSNVVVNSFTSDDFYGLLEDGEGEADGTEDIGIGRMPVSDTAQAGIIISKIKKYLDPVNMGDWKNIICITADDEDGNAHMSDAEGLASVLKDSVPEYNIDKIYLDAFKQTTNVGGQSYPDVNKAITARINNGCLIFNYVGHGGEGGLAHEGVIKPEDINSWKNGGKLPLFITATCEFSRFDDAEMNVATHELFGKTSAGEMVLLNKEGGAIALMSTTRVVYSAPNFFLNRNIFNYAFSRDEDGNALTLGDIIRIAKNKSGSGPNKRNFTLLGDPALTLAYPWHGKIITDSVNNVSVTEKTDSLKALSVVTISGHIEDKNGVHMNSFNGVVSPQVYDKESKIKTLANDGGQTLEFNLRNSIIFSGKTRARNGKFSFTFIVPRDINYTFGNGKISYYANENNEDMNGSFNNIIVGGFSSTAVFDTSGPVIRLFLNDTLFRNGGITDKNPRLLAIIEDKGGINTSGSGIGHDITGFLDKEVTLPIVLNNYYTNDFDNYSRGTISYNLTDLSMGSHSITVKAWDNFNNSSEQTISFFVESEDKFILKNLINYPNPFFTETNITGEHNRPDTELEVTINIFNLSGRIIKIIKTRVPSTGYSIPPVTWDGNDDSGRRVGKGIYPYSVTIKVSEGTGETARASGRMIIL
ncbi:MAG: type IX secretion system sortase PorU [Bacteroidales bacterium]|nr:type IX secretion system sortase PorU [Bacteroidales bacterium]